LLAVLVNFHHVLAAEPASLNDASNTPPTQAVAVQPALSNDDSNMPPVTLESPPPENRNRLALSYRMGLNISVDFKKLGGFPALTDPGPSTGSTANRNYDNGYNRVDISTNAGGLTWNWGYQNANQIQGNSIVLDSSSSLNNGSSNGHQNDPQHGLELSYSRELHRSDNDKWRFGLEGAFGLSFIDVSDSSTVLTTVNRITDTYTVPGGVFVIPSAPYNGTFQGPGPVISSSLGTGTGVRTITAIPGAAVVTGERALDANVYMIRLGPYLEIPLSRKFSAILNGGLTLAFADVDFTYRETVTIAGVGSVSRSSTGGETDFLVGGYIGGAISYAVTKEISVFAGAQWEAAGSSVSNSRLLNNQVDTKKESVLDLGKSIILNFGVAYSF
jgi:hypothetical protein